MPIINDPDDLTQGAATQTASVSIGAPTARESVITAASGLPALTAGDFFVIRNSPDTQNNGVWVETGGAPSATSITATKVSGADPIAGGPDTLDFLGNTTTPANVCLDVATREIYLVEQNGLGAEGVEWQTLYSFLVISWKDDNFLIGNAPFPMNTISAIAGQYIMGEDAGANANGWSLADSVTHSVRSFKMVRSGGVSIIDTSGNLVVVEVGVSTLGVFEDPANDTAYYQFGNDTEVDDTVDFTFAGPVNEMVRCFERLADDAINGGTGIAISADGRTLTRSDGGNWRTDGFVVGGRVVFRDAANSTTNTLLDGNVPRGGFLLTAVGTGVDGAIELGTAADATTGFAITGTNTITRNDGGSWIDEGYFATGIIYADNAEDVGNDAVWTISTITDTVIVVTSSTMTNNAADTTITFSPVNPTGSPDTVINAAVDNRNALKTGLRVRDGDTNGKTFGQATLANTAFASLVNALVSFPLANVTDLKITETDANIDGNAPYTGMSLSVYATPQSLGGSGVLVGGPFNFGFVVTCNNGTNIEVFEWLQRQLRKLTDIDAEGAEPAIGRTLDGMARFLGDAFEAGSPDGGLTFPRNPQGGGSGVFLSGLNAASKNTSTMYDNTGTVRSFPIGTPVTLDFNQTALDDSVFKYTLFFDYTIRTDSATLTDLVINAGTGPIGTFTSAGSNLPASLDAGVGAYVRISALTGVDAAMNGIYQVTSIAAGTYNVVRYDNSDIVTTTVAGANLDEHPVDSPDQIIVQDDVPANVTGTNPATDYTFTFAYSTNVQGGRTAAEDAFVVLRGIGQATGQYAASDVATIPSATATTIPLATQLERNFLNP